MYPDRKTAARLGQETLRILAEGAYAAPSGTRVEIADAVAAARRETRSIRFDARLPARAPRLGPPAPIRIEVTGESTLAAARRLFDDDSFDRAGVVTALNFASARHPGGGFASGARAQEESLARSSALFACLEGDAFYTHHEAVRDPMYTDWAIHAPRVPVLRDEHGVLLERPWPCTFLTCAAVNAKVVLERDPTRAEEVREVMRRRVARVLDVAHAMGDRRLVLGAWGCGVFGNEPAVLASLFDEALTARAGAFDHIVFAILDASQEQRFRGPFAARFGAAHAG